MINKTGTVDKLARNGKAFTLSEDPGTIWYTSFAPSQLNGCNSGDQVSFGFIEKLSGGMTFNNIKGDVNIISKGSGSVVLPTTGASPPMTFGSITLSKDRSIARQNACNVAATFLQEGFRRMDITIDGEDTDGSEISSDKIATLILSVAKQIEAYTTGDSDKAEVLAEVDNIEE